MFPYTLCSVAYLIYHHNTRTIFKTLVVRGSYIRTFEESLGSWTYTCAVFVTFRAPPHHSCGTDRLWLEFTWFLPRPLGSISVRTSSSKRLWGGPRSENFSFLTTAEVIFFSWLFNDTVSVETIERRHRGCSSHIVSCVLFQNCSTNTPPASCFVAQQTMCQNGNLSDLEIHVMTLGNEMYNMCNHYCVIKRHILFHY